MNHERALLRLAAQFLEEYADVLSNQGCNEWTVPEWLPQSARETLQGDDKDVPLAGYNWLAARGLARWLRAASEEGKHE